MNMKPWEFPQKEEPKEQKEKRRREYEKKYGYMQQNIDGITKIFPNMSKDEVCSDVLGSYTGTPIGGGVPEQDVDDL